MTQATNVIMTTFLSAPLPYGLLFLIGVLVFTFITTFLILRSFHLGQLNKLKALARERERAVADLEAQAAQITAELDELRKGEAIIIHRNGILESQVKEYNVLCSQQEKRIQTIETLFS